MKQARIQPNSPKLSPIVLFKNILAMTESIFTCSSTISTIGFCMSSKRTHYTNKGSINSFIDVLSKIERVLTCFFEI